MVEGYRPSIARLYDAEDGTQHFTHFADGKCVLIFMAEGNPRIAKATGEGIAEIVARYPQCQRVDSKLIETWFNNLNWGPDKVAAAADPQNRQHGLYHRSVRLLELHSRNLRKRY